MSRPSVSSSAGEEVDRVWARMRPQAVKVLQDLKRKAGANINDIEGASAAIGDLLTRGLVQQVMAQQSPATEAEVAAACGEALQRAEPEKASGQRAEALRVVRQQGRSCELKTIRGPVPYAREYLYFPDLGVGVFPPRPAAGYSG